ATSLTLVNAGDAAIFSIGDWIYITGIELQTCCGFPPNFQRFESRLITNISGSTITINAPLTNTYLTTWPSIQSDNSMNNNGPARIYKMQPNWNVSYTIYGGTVTATTPPNDQDQLAGRNIAIYDTVFQTTNTAPSVVQNGWLIGTSANGMEIDKDI